MLTLLFSIRDCFRARAALQAEILALRQQLLVLQRSNCGHKLHLRFADRVLWVSEQHLAQRCQLPKPVKLIAESPVLHRFCYATRRYLNTCLSKNPPGEQKPIKFATCTRVMDSTKQQRECQ